MRTLAQNLALLLLGLTLSSPPLPASNPSLSVIVPRGAQRGATAEVRFRGSGFTEAVDLLFHDPGIALASLTVESEKVVKTILDISPEARLGPHAIRLRTGTGLSNLQFFSVGNLTEVTEVEPNNGPETAHKIELDTTVNGVVPNEDADYFAVDLKPGQRLAVEIEGIRLGRALFDPKLRLFGPGGHELVSEDDTPLIQQDAAFVWVAEETGTHLVVVTEAAYGGANAFDYRLHVGTFPRPLSMTPIGGVAGASVEVKWLGDPGNETGLVEVPSGPVGSTARIPVRNDRGESPTGQPFRIADFSGVAEVEPNNGADQASEGQIPGAFEGVLESPGDVDWFQFQGKTGQEMTAQVFARRLGSPLDSVLLVKNPSGSNLASVDDSGGPDSAATFSLPEDGTYTLRITDHLGRGGEQFAYRVEVSPPQPKVAINLLENDGATLNVPQGNRAFVMLNVARERFDGELRIEAPGLPPGASVDCDNLPGGESSVPMVFSAVADATPEGGLPEVTATLVSEDSQISGGLNHPVVLVYGNNKVIFVKRDVDRLAMAISKPAPFKIDLIEPQTPVVQRGNKKLAIRATRSEGFDGEIALRIPWRPSGIGAGTAKIPAGATETTISIDANAGAKIQTRRLAVVGTSAGYTVSTALVPIKVEKPWVTFEVPQLETEQGKPVDFHVAVTQNKPYSGSYQAELVGLPKGVTTEPQTLTSETTELVFPVAVAEDSPEGKHQGFFVRTVLSATGEEEVLHQWGGGQLTVYKPLPAELQKAPEPEPAPDAPPKPEEPKRKTRFPTSS